MLALNFKANIMGKSKRKVAHSKKEEEQAQALSRAISVAIKSLSKDALDYIKEISGGDTVGYLTTRIQAQISRNKGVSK